MISCHQLAFHIFGQNTYNPLLHSCHNYFLVFQYIPTLVMSSSLFATIVYATSQEPFFSASSDWTDSIVGSLYEITYLLQATALIFQSFCHQRKFNEMVQITEYIEKNLQQQFELKIDYNQFIKQYLLKTTLALLCWLLTIFSKFCFPKNGVGIGLELCYTFARFSGIVINLYVEFYVSLLHSFIALLRDVQFNGNNGKCVDYYYPLNTCGSITRLFIIYKMMHFKMCEVASYVNKIFGWTLVAAILRSFIELSYLIYWVFYFLQKDEYEFLLVLRKYMIYFNY